MSRVSPGVLGLVLAGGQGRRMGGAPKVLRDLHGASLLVHALRRLAPQVDDLVVSSGQPEVAAASAPYAVLEDPVPGFAGPLAGVLAGLEHLRDAHPGRRWLVSVAADTPCFPVDLVLRLRQAAASTGAEVAVACSGGRPHPVFALWSVSLAGRLRRALVEEGERGVQRFQSACRTVDVDWPCDPCDPFFNVNTPEDLVEAARLLAAAPP